MLTLNHPQLGLVQLRVHSSARRKIFKVTPNVVIITVPPGYEDSVFPLDKSTLNSILKIRNRIVAKSGSNAKFEIGEPLETLTFKTNILFNDNPKVRSYTAKLEDGILKIKIPSGLDPDSEIVQKALLRILHKFLKQEAELVLPEKIEQLADRFGFVYRSVKVDSARSRWGCCSSFKDIKLSFYLLLLPERLIDYVIVHELCHTKEMNHGPRFKSLLHGLFYDYQKIEKEKVEWDYKVAWLKNKI